MDRTTTTTTNGLLTGKVAFITGAGRGIGAAAARLFAREGASVVLAARTGSEIEQVAQEIRADGGTAEHTTCDLADAASVRAAVDGVVERFGRLDVAFNNAGAATVPAPLDELPEADFDHLTAVNYKGVWLAMSAEVRAIKESAGSGAIVNNSSVGSARGNPGMGAYGAAKRAVNSLTETAAAEYGPDGVRVNAVTPGTTMTEMMQQWVAAEPDVLERQRVLTPLDRPGEPEEVAEAAAWLLSDRASYVTGAILPVDGGMAA